MNNSINKLPTGDFQVAKTPVVVELSPEEQEAMRRYNLGQHYSCSTFIDEDTIVAGYGKLDYDFEFPLPTKLIKEIYGTTSWSEWTRKQKLSS